MMTRTRADKTTKLVMHIVLGTACLLCLIPMLLIVAISFTNEREIVYNGYRLFPHEFSLRAYEIIFERPTALLNAYWVTIRITVFGTILGTVFMAMAAFSLSRRDFGWRKPIVFIFLFTMLFDAGIVPTYMLITQYLRMQNTLLVLFLPLMITAWHTILLITYMRQLPFELIESAKVEGAGEFYIFLRIAVPLSKPALATISLLLALQLWNEWFYALLFITERDLVPLQFWMQRVMRDIQFLLQHQSQMAGGIDLSNLPTETTRMAMAVLAAGPMMFVFPFFQRYFARGLQVGSIKG
jgi:putative aldouronate transport system permease protein